MSKVFRVHDSQCRGPFKPGFSSQWVIPRPDHDNLLPYFVEFKHIDFYNGRNMAIGCRTIVQLRRWFTAREYRSLIQLGYHAVIVDDVNVVAESSTQSVFEYIPPMICKPIRLY